MIEIINFNAVCYIEYTLRFRGKTPTADFPGHVFYCCHNVSFNSIFNPCYSYTNLQRERSYKLNIKYKLASLASESMLVLQMFFYYSTVCIIIYTIKFYVKTEL